MTVIERSRQDIAEGRLWKARDRLTGALGHRPHDTEVLERLAEVYLAMGDVPAAGRFLMLSARDDDVARDARDTFRRLRQASSYSLAVAVPAKQPLDRYPPVVQERLRELSDRARSDGIEVKWMRLRSEDGSDHGEGGRGESLVVTALVALFVIPWLVGLVYLVVMVARWIVERL